MRFSLASPQHWAKTRKDDGKFLSCCFRIFWIIVESGAHVLDFCIHSSQSFSVVGCCHREGEIHNESRSVIFPASSDSLLNFNEKWNLNYRRYQTTLMITTRWHFILINWKIIKGRRRKIWKSSKSASRTSPFFIQRWTVFTWENMWKNRRRLQTHINRVSVI